MYAITTDGVELEIMPGEALTGMQFRSVVLMVDDFRTQEDVDWFVNCVIGRIRPPGITFQ